LVAVGVLAGEVKSVKDAAKASADLNGKVAALTTSNHAQVKEAAAELTNLLA